VTDAHAYLRRLSDEIVALQKPIRILKAINWDPKVHARFFADKARRLPRVEYPPLGFHARSLAREFWTLRKRIKGKNPVEELLRDKCEEFSLIARMLDARGTQAFFEYSVRIYGDPRDTAQKDVDNLEVARLWASRPRARAEQAVLDSTQAAEVIQRIIAPHLGKACRVKESTRITANAAAGATSVAVKRGAFFSERQVRALAHHEGLWHVLTSLNGFRQPTLTILGVGLARFTESQEGAGIVSEYLTGNITDDRFIELGERTLAVDMAARGADFLEVYDYLCRRFAPQKASLMAERVFRGGVMTGGGPFTKDAVYQRGYCRAYNFLRVALSKPDPGLLHAFLAGKLRVDDAPLIKQLIEEGICVGPTYLPEWYLDQDWLAARATHSITVNRFSVKRGTRYFEKRSAAATAFEWEPEPRAALSTELEQAIVGELPVPKEPDA
jgi:uncharacterized protein (TIGR02421 family)